MCTPDFNPEPLPPPPLVLPQPQYNASEIFGRRDRRADPRNKSSFTASTFASAIGVPAANPNPTRTLLGG